MRLFLSILLLSCLSACDQYSIGYKQIYSGFNGPPIPVTTVIATADAASSSWLKMAVADNLDHVLSQVDFNHQVLVVAAVGERPTATGRLEIRKIDSRPSIIEPYVQIGVNDDGCGVPAGKSYPFVIAVIEKPEKPISAGGFDHQNFPDGCKPVVSGIAHSAI